MKKQKKKKSKIRINESGVKQILFEDDSVRVSYFGHPSNKAPTTYLEVTFITENISTSSEAIKSIKISLSKSISFRPKDKSKSTYSLGKKLQSKSEHRSIIKLKCNDYGTEKGDSIKCKISYNSFKSESLSIKFPTHCFIISESERYQQIVDKQSLMKIAEDEEKCKYKITERLKLPKNISCGDSLDTLVKIWRVHNVTMTDKKSTYYASLMLDKHLTIYVKTNKDKGAIEMTLSGHKEQFLQNMLTEFKAILFP